MTLILILMLFAFFVGVFGSHVRSKRKYGEILEALHCDIRDDAAILFALNAIRDMLACGCIVAATTGGITYVIGLLLGKF